MFNVLIDTSVWLDIAQDPKQALLLDPIETMVELEDVRLLLPRIVLNEFQKNRAKVAERAQRGLSAHFNPVKEAIRKIEGDAKQKKKILQYLSDIDHRIPLVGGTAAETLNRIDTLFRSIAPIELTDEIKARAADRALNRKAPCHRDNKNSIADASIIETYFNCVAKGRSGDRFAFVTHNKHDFGDMMNNQRAVHPDLLSGFVVVVTSFLRVIQK